MRGTKPRKGNGEQKRVGKSGEVKLVRADSLTRTKQILNAALRVWELKQRSGSGN